MSSPSCSNSLQNSGSGGSGSEGIIDERKRKRMISNRESARRSRMRKQQHLDGLSAQLEQLKKENDQISTSIGVTTHMFIKVEAENAILRAQIGELSNRLESLNEIIRFMNSNNNNNNYVVGFDEAQENFFNDCGFFMESAWNNNNSFSLNQPIMSSPDMLMY